MDSGLFERAAYGPPQTPEQKAAAKAAKDLNKELGSFLLIIISAISVAVIVWRVSVSVSRLVRTIACLGHERQRYFAIPSATLASVKRHILYAPIFSKRHNREIQLSSAVNVGTLPTRFQLLFLVTYFAINVAFCVIQIPYAKTNDIILTQVRNRSGALSTINMVPLFLLAGRNNPLIPLLGISFDTYNLIHRWLGRIVVIEAVVHTLAHLAKGGWGPSLMSIPSSPGLLAGLIATCAFIFIAFQASSPFRHAFYECFKLLHIASALLAAGALTYHLFDKGQFYLSYMYATLALWAADRCARLIRILYSHVGGARSRTIIEALPGNAVRLTMTMARPWTARPGQHAYLYMPSIGFWQSHPFSIAWVRGVDDTSADRLATTRQDLMSNQQMEVSYVIRARTGFTDSLYRKALAAPGGRLETTCFAEGPYGGHHCLDSFGTVVLFAGGVGITHQVPYVQHLVDGYANDMVATRRILLVWVIQTPEHLEWIRNWMTEILAMEKRRDVLRIMLFVSQPRSTKEIHSPSSTVQMFPGRPNIGTLLSMEQEHQVGSMCVTVCGPGAFSDEVRRAVRDRQERSSIDFIEEAFTW